jgi:CubicO group peptidase (beta-lactamase class C family)
MNREGLMARGEALVTSLRAFIPQAMRLDHIPGLNAVVARRGSVIWEEGFGHAHLETMTPMTPRTVLRSGSMGKTYTATAVMQLVEQGALGLHEEINRHLPFRVTNPLGEREITFYDLLTHRSGMTSNNASPDFRHPVPLGEHLRDGFARNVHDLYRGSAEPRWSTKVGSTFQYSNYGMALLGYLVEVANPDGLSFSEYVHRHILAPLKMWSTSYPPIQDPPHVDPDILARVAAGYAGFGPINIPTPRIHFADYPAGNVLTIPSDHVRMLLAYMNGGELDGRRILQPETVRLMLTPQAAWLGSTDAVGLVWAIGNHGKRDYWFGHMGAHMFGWHSSFRAYPNLDLAMVVATNRWDIAWWSSEAPRKHISELIFEHAANVLSEESTPKPKRSWSWKVCYAAGVMLTEQMVALLSITSPLTRDMVSAMATGSRVMETVRGEDLAWDREAFEAGVADVLEAEPTISGIRAWMQSNSLKIDRADLELIYRQLGGDGPYPVPATSWS